MGLGHVTRTLCTWQLRCRVPSRDQLVTVSPGKAGGNPYTRGRGNRHVSVTDETERARVNGHVLLLQALL